MRHLRCFPVLFAKVLSPGGLPGIRSTFARVCVLAYFLGLCWPAIAQTATTTTLTLTSGGSAVTTVETGTMVTLTATVTAGSTPVTPGIVNFCDATAAHCTDIHIVATAQLTSSGTAVFKFRPGLGSRSYKAVFVGTNAYAGSSTSAASLTVTPLAGVSATTTIIAATETGTNPDVYTLAATVTGAPGYGVPTGEVSFLDASNGNALLATANLGPGAPIWPSSNYPFFPAGVSPVTVIPADFNGDGIPDLAIMDIAGDTVTVLLGNGDGTFQPPITTPIAALVPWSMVEGDLNGDGIPDLAYLSVSADPGSTEMSILLGNGDGTFTAGATYTVAQVNEEDVSIAVADFNRDGILDLAVPNAGNDTMGIFLGNGDGTFAQTSSSPSTGDEPIGAAVGDFNGDGIPDLAVTDYGASSITILLGNGDGTFTSNTFSEGAATGQEPFAIVAADFNGDGTPDLAVVHEVANMISVFTGKGDGTFTPSWQYVFGVAQDIAVADFNGDGIPDLAVPTGGQIPLLLGVGDGTFTQAPHPPVLGGYLAIADFNGDGVPDLAGLNADGNEENSITAAIVLTPISSTATVTGISLPTGAGDSDVEASYPGDSSHSSSISGPATLNAGSTALATITSPFPGLGEVLRASNVSFQWTTGTGVTLYQLTLGTTGPGSSDVFSYTGTGTGIFVSTLPVNGATVYARLSSKINGAWQYNDFLYTATGTPVPATLTAPIPELNRVLGTSNVTFQWQPGNGVAQFRLTLGTTGLGSSDLFSYTGSATSVIVPTLPPYGAVVYAMLYSEINGVWLSNEYLYIESGPAVLETPSPGLADILGTSNLTFQWTTGAETTLYQFTLGTTGIGSSNLFSYTGSATSVTVPTLPANGVTVYATLYSKVNGTWLHNDYYYTESNAAVLTSPIPGLGTVLGTSDVGFQWTAGAAVTVYELDLGTLAPGARDLYVYKGTGTSTIVPSLPAHGETVYARLYSYISNVWQFNDYVYTESGTLVPAVLTSPTPGLSTVLGTSDVTFQWTTGTGANLYQLNLSATVPGGSDLYLYKGTATSTIVSNIPANGAIVYARLYSSLNGKWIFDDTAYYSDYVYTESGTPVSAILTFPSPGLTTVLGTSDVLFQWTEGAGATLYQLNLSAIAPGGEDLYVYKGMATSTSAPSLPANGVKVYARLYSYINKAWRYNDYVYTEQ
jgi:hypothetical protein